VDRPENPGGSGRARAIHASAYLSLDPGIAETWESLLRPTMPGPQVLCATGDLLRERCEVVVDPALTGGEVELVYQDS
jgi:hypothetical protein